MVGESAALDLANTLFIDGGLRGQRVDGLATVEALHGWIVQQAGFDHRPAGWPAVDTGTQLSPQHLALFLELRKVLRGLFAAVTEGRSPERADLEALGEFTRRAAGWWQLRSGNPVEVVQRWPGDDPVAAAAGLCAVDAAAILQHHHALLEACPAPACILFYLQNRRGTRRYCSAACGNRVRVARHKKAQGRHEP